MPAKNPRINVTVTPSTFAQMQQLSALTGNSVSSIVADILEQSAPVFSRIIVVLSAAQTAKQEAIDHVVGNMERAQARIEDAVGLSLVDFEEAGEAVTSALHEVKRRGRRDVAGDASAAPITARRSRQTPPSNRGVRSTDKTQKTAQKNSFPGRGHRQS